MADWRTWLNVVLGAVVTVLATVALGLFASEIRDALGFRYWQWSYSTLDVLAWTVFAAIVSLAPLAGGFVTAARQGEGSPNGRRVGLRVGALVVLPLLVVYYPVWTITAGFIAGVNEFRGPIGALASLAILGFSVAHIVGFSALGGQLGYAHTKRSTESR